MLKETDAEATLKNCRALIDEIDARLSAKKLFINVSSAAELLLYLEFALLFSKSLEPHAREAFTCPGAEGYRRGAVSATDNSGRSSSLAGLSPFLFEEFGSALKGYVKVCQQSPLTGLLLVTKHDLNLVREGAAPIQRCFDSGLLGRR
jgi:hypothetical protein